jgi:hypothetical protein
MAGYLNQNGNSIGSLLRFIQEQKSQSPIIPPSTEASSPIRGVTQEPLKAPEDIGTSKVVSLRPEGTIGTGQGQPISQGVPQGDSSQPPFTTENFNRATMPQRQAYGWLGMGGGPINVTAANEPGSGMTIPSATRTMGDVVNQTGAASGSRASISQPVIGTKITGSPTTVGQTVSQPNKVYSSSGQDITPSQFILQQTEANQQFADEMSQPGAIEAYINKGMPGSSPQSNEKAKQGVINRVQEIVQARNIPQNNTPSQTYVSQKQSTPTPAIYKAPVQVIAPVVQKAVQQAAQKIAPVITQSPWSWLGKKTGWW